MSVHVVSTAPEGAANQPSDDNGDDNASTEKEGEPPKLPEVWYTALYFLVNNTS